MLSSDMAGHENTQRIFADFLKYFIAYIKTRRLYPPGHDRVKNQSKLLFEAIDKIFSSQDSISFLIHPKSITVCGVVFDDKDQNISQFAPEFIKRQIRYMIIENGVTQKEIDSLIQLMLMDPIEIQEAGGAVTILDQEETHHILLFEFSYDMNSFIKSDDDFDTIKTLIQYAHGPTTKSYILKRLNEMDLNDEHHGRLKKLVQEEDIKYELSALHDLFGAMPSEVKNNIHTSDFLLQLMGCFNKSPCSVEKIKDSDITRIFKCVLNRLHGKLQGFLDPETDLSDIEGLEGFEDIPHEQLLEKIVRNLISSPKSLVQWLSMDEKHFEVKLSSNQNAILKSIFSVPEDGRRKIRFGKTTLETLESPSSNGSESLDLDLDQINIEPAPLKEMETLFLKLKQEFSSVHINLAKPPHPIIYIDTILEMIGLEKDWYSKARIIEELERFLNRRMGDKTDRAHLDCLKKIVSKLKDSDITCLLKSSAMYRLILNKYLHGETQWKKALLQPENRRPSTIVSCIGKMIMEDTNPPQEISLKEFLLPYQEKMVNWMISYINNNPPPYPIERIIPVIQICNTSRVVTLTNLLFENMSMLDCQPLIESLILAGNPHTIRSVIMLHEKVDKSSRIYIYQQLRKSSHPAAEQLFLKVADFRKSNKTFHPEERNAAIDALKECGTSRSLDLLESLSKRWTLIFTSNGRKTRTLAADAIVAIKMRLAQRRDRL